MTCSCSFLKAWYSLGRAWAGLKWHEQAIEDLEQAVFYEVSANRKNEISHGFARSRIWMAIGDQEFLDMDCGEGKQENFILEVQRIFGDFSAKFGACIAKLSSKALPW